MRWLAEVRERARGVFFRAREDADLDEELRFHIDMEAERLVREQGLDRREARRRAGVGFGGVEKHKEAVREARGLAWVPGWWLDLKLGARMLSKYPGLTLVGGLAMAFAIGAGAATFEVVREAVRPSLPLPGGERLVGIRNWDAARSDPEDRAARDWARWREGLSTIEQVSAFRTVQRNLAGPDVPAGGVSVAEISASGLRLAGVSPLLGRSLLEEDERPGAPPVLVIGHDAWRRRFGGDPRVLGRSVLLGAGEYTIVGVMPEGFGFPFNHQYWTALRVDAASFGVREGPSLRVFGRLAPGATLEEAQAELALLARRAAAEWPDTHEHLRPRVLPYAESLTPMRLDGTVIAGAYSVNLLLVVFMALICANVAALVYARTVTREAEIVVRNALGASRRRIMGQLFAEALVLASGAAVVGLLFANLGLRWGLGVFEAVQGEGEMDLPFWVDAALSPATILYAALLTLLVAALTGVVPALKATRGLGAQLRQASAGGGGLRFGWVWTLVIVAQVALTVLALPIIIDAALDTVELQRAEVGIPAEQYLTADIRLERETSTGVPIDTSEAAFAARVDATYQALERRLSADPAVLGVTYASQLPGGYHGRRRIDVDGLPGGDGPGQERSVQIAAVAPDFFGAVGVEVRSGRGFSEGDVASQAGVALVNPSFVEHVLGGRNPIGRRVRYADTTEEPGPQPGEWHEIVGVADELMLTSDPDLPHNAGLYLPASPGGAYPFRVAVRVRGAPESFAPRLRSIATAVDPGIRLRDVRPLDEIRWDLVLSYLFWLQVALVGCGLTMLLSLAGIYAVTSFTVTRRTREIGIRIALGASPRRVIGSIFSRTFAQVGAGVAVGALLLFAMAGFRITPRLGALIAAGMAVMLATSALACVLPTRRALRVQPTEALRADA